MANPQKQLPDPKSFDELKALIPNPEHDPYEFFSDAGARRIQPRTEFVRDTAWFLMEISYLSYAVDPNFVEEQLKKIGLQCKVFGFDQDHPPHIVVAHNDEVAVVAFRGTRVQALADILADLDFIEEPTTAGAIHRGFQGAFDAGGLWTEARAYVRQLGNQVVMFTGHSLGAALATLARRSFQEEVARRQALYTFGSPRVGAQTGFCLGFPENTYRIVNDEDLVAHIPTPPLYGHVGTALGIDGQPLQANRWEFLEDQFRFIGAALSRANLAARNERLQGVFAENIKPLWDHAPRCYATKIWNAL